MDIGTEGGYGLTMRVFACLRCALLAVGLAGGLSAAHGADAPGVVAGPALKWDVSLWGKPRAGTVVADALASQVAERTEGRWRLALHYGEALSKARENLDGLEIGAFEAAMFCNFYHPRKTPALMALTLPFLPMQTWQDNRRIRDAVYAHPAVVKELARWNAQAYTSSFLPLYEFLGRGEPPTGLDGWRGLTVRAGGGLGRAMQRLGATPASSTATEVYTGVQQGTMDAASFPFTYSHVAYRIHEVADWYTGNLAAGTADCPLAFSITAYQALPPQYRQLLDDVKEAVVAAQIQAYVDVDMVNLPMLQETLQEVRYSEAQLARFRAIAGKPVIDEWIAAHQDRFDARGLVETIFGAVGRRYD